DSGKLLLSLALLLLGLALVLLLGLPIETLLLVGLALLLSVLRHALLVGAGLDPPPLGLLLALLLLSLLDDGLDHPPEHGLVDAELLGVSLVLDVVLPFDRGQPAQPLDLEPEAARALIGAGEADDAVGLGIVGSVHRSSRIAFEWTLGERRQPGVDFARQPHRLAADDARTREFARAHPRPDRGVGDVRDFADLRLVEQTLAALRLRHFGHPSIRMPERARNKKGPPAHRVRIRGPVWHSP